MMEVNSIKYSMVILLSHILYKSLAHFHSPMIIKGAFQETVFEKVSFGHGFTKQPSKIII